MSSGFEAQAATTVDASFHSGLIDSLAELIVKFVTTNISLKIILLVVNIPVYFLLAKLIFGSWQRFWRLAKYGLIPMFFFTASRRNTLRKDFSEGVTSWRERGLHVFLDFSWIALYFVQYFLIKTLFVK